MGTVYRGLGYKESGGKVLGPKLPTFWLGNCLGLKLQEVDIA